MDATDLCYTPATELARLVRTKKHCRPHEWDWFDWASFSYPFNFTGQPAPGLGGVRGGPPLGRPPTAGLVSVTVVS